MEGECRESAVAVIPDDLRQRPQAYDWFAALLLIEARSRRLLETTPAELDNKRLGDMRNPASEPLRLGQQPALHFVGSDIAGWGNASTVKPWLLQYSFGIFGTNGPMPLHMSHYALRESPVFLRFANLFHHRLLSLHYRSWYLARPTAELDERVHTGFRHKIRALTGRQEKADGPAERFLDGFAAALAQRCRNREKLQVILHHLLGTSVQIDTYIPYWLEKSPDQYSCLGKQLHTLGQDLQLGKRVLTVQATVQVTLGPLTTEQYLSLLPGGRASVVLSQILRAYCLQETRIRVQLQAESPRVLCRTLSAAAVPPAPEHQVRLGFNSWLGKSEMRAVAVQGAAWSC